MKVDLNSLLNSSGIEIAEISPGSYVAEWFDVTSQFDYDFVIKFQENTLHVAHPLGRPSLKNQNEIKHVIGNIIHSSFYKLALLQQEDGDLMLHRHVPSDEFSSLTQILLEICRYKEEIRKSYVWEQLVMDDLSEIRSHVNCDWCGIKTERFHAFQSLEVCQECYINFPKCSSCYTVIGHSLSEATKIGNKRYCNSCFSKKHNCSYCNEPLNVFYFIDNRNGNALCFKCRSFQSVPEAAVSRALPIVLNIIHDIFRLNTESFYNIELCDSSKLQLHYQAKGHRNYLKHTILGLFDGRNIFLSKDLSLQAYIEVISHEYFHYLQRKYLPGWVELEVIEGFAMWGETIVQRYIDDKDSLKNKERYVVSETVYTKGLSFFKLLENKYGTQGVWDWMQTIKPYPLVQLIELENLDNNSLTKG